MSGEVVIWSGEHRLYWRANAAGYVGDIRDAGRYTQADALARTRHAGPEKMIEIRPAPSNSVAPPPDPALALLRKLVNECDAILSIAESAMREAAGHSNVGALKHHMEAARAHLKERGDE